MTHTLNVCHVQGHVQGPDAFLASELAVLALTPPMSPPAIRIAAAKISIWQIWI